jgi:hypothetical protein
MDAKRNKIDNVMYRTAIRYQIALLALLLLLGGIPAFAQVLISPAVPPVVNEGTSFKFTANVPVTWSCPGCAGSISSDGTYQAPQSVTSHQSYGGFQLLPNDHIFNTRVDTLPVNPSSPVWIAGAGTAHLNFLPTFPVNYVNSSTPTQNIVFQYTPANNGLYKIPQYPTARIQSGWFSLPFGGWDRHFFSIDTDTGVFQEMYNYYPTGANSGCAACNSQSGVIYQNSSYALPTNGSTNAAGTFIMPLTLRLQEWENAVATGGTINHALAMTLPNGYIQLHGKIWPATTTTSAGGGVIPYGARFRLKPTYDISGFTPAAQILLKQLKEYGLILTDGGLGWLVATEYTRWPPTYYNAFVEIGGAKIQAQDFEAVDESSLEVFPMSGNTNGGETVVATAIANPAQTARQQVVLTGVTLSLPQDQFYIQVGAAPQQLIAYTNGSSTKGITWSISPAVGALTNNGLYTPPGLVGSVTTATVKATSLADPAVSAEMLLTVFPAGPIRIVNGQSKPYTDSHGNVWANNTGDDGGFIYDNGGSFPNASDITLYKVAYNSYDSGGDMRFDIHVPDGTYNITVKKASQTCAPGELMSFEAQGTIVLRDADVYRLAGACHLPRDFTLPAVVTGGLLSFVVRTGSTTTYGANIEALEIDPGQSAPTESGPQPPSNLSIIQVK